VYCEEAAFLSSAQVNSYETRVTLHEVKSHAHKKVGHGFCERGAAGGVWIQGEEVTGSGRRFCML